MARHVPSVRRPRLSIAADLHELHRLARHFASRYGFARLTDAAELAALAIFTAGVAAVGMGIVG